MELNELTAISPVDGRYRDKTKELAPYFSEFGLIKCRVLVEIEYFIALCELPLPELKSFDRSQFIALREIYKSFSIAGAQRVKEIERTTNHDVKAVEYFLKEQFDILGISKYKEFIHFGLTSQDINNTATPFLLRDFMQDVYYPYIDKLLSKLIELGDTWSEVPMLAHTHGQPASPTRVGKEIMVFVERIEKQLHLLKTVPYSAKFGGATGNFNAHAIAYPEVDWVEFSNAFVNHVLFLDRSQTTTQIDHYDNLAAIFDGIKRINNIFIDLNRDFWTYISMDYFKQQIKKDEVGSSAMPHKVNPIDFENSEGNLGLANAFFEHLSAKLPVSRMQRDLTDSTVLRNIGVPMAHTLISYKSLYKGLGKIVINEAKLYQDLEDNWMVVSEAIQTILRREGYPHPYEALKELTRNNQKAGKEAIHSFIDHLSVTDELKKKLKEITPHNYTGL
jgi:adenylosuccinate lyase